jgi:hypothetical protein
MEKKEIRKQYGYGKMPIYAAYICVVMVEEAGYFSGTRLRTWTGSEDLRGVLAPCWTASKILSLVVPKLLLFVARNLKSS